MTDILQQLAAGERDQLHITAIHLVRLDQAPK